jgi:hypothetical protein
MVLKSKESYRLDEEGGIFIVIVLDTSHCPICQSVLTMRATRQRVCWKGEEDKEILLIRRLYCDKCKRIHHELPDCLVPYKRYSADAIENIVDGQAVEDAPCPESTVKRLRGWWSAVKQYFLHILLTLMEKFGVSFGSPPAFRETVRAVANSNNWIFAHQVCTRSASRPE